MSERIQAFNPPSMAAQAGLPEGRGKRPPLTLRTLGEMEAYVPPKGDLILGNGFLVKGERTTLLGQGGIGKSRLALQLALCCCAGEPFLEWPTDGRHLKWLFLQTENGNRRLQQDLVKMRSGFNDDAWEIIQRHICFHTLEGEGDGIILIDRLEDFERASDAIVRCEADVVVIDPLRDVHSGNLNDDAEMTNACRNISQLMRAGGRTDRACLVLHHARTGRTGITKTTGYDRSDFGRNSKVLHGWTRAQINLAPGSPDDCELLVMASGKNNNFKEFKPLAIRLDPETLLYEVDSTFDLDAWKEGVDGTRRGGSATEQDVLAALDEGGGRVEKKVLVQKTCDRTGCGSRKVETLLRSMLGGSIWEVKEPRAGARDAIFIERKPGHA